MKTTHVLLAAVLAATSAIQAATTEHKLPAPMPAFKTPEQLAVWRKEMNEKAKAADALAAKQSNFEPTASTSAFYTGKPFLQDTGSYAFKYRNYDPELNRWTTIDPSGFPDGANNTIYSANPLTNFDNNGLTLYTFNFTLYAYYSKTTSSASFLPFSISMAASAASLAAMSSGPVSAVFTVVGASMAVVPSTPSGYALLNQNIISGWGENGAPPSGGNYYGLSLTSVNTDIRNSTIHYPVDGNGNPINPGGPDFFDPMQTAMGVQISNGEIPSRGDWENNAPSNVPYPQDPGSTTLSVIAATWSASLSLNIE